MNSFSNIIASLRRFRNRKSTLSGATIGLVPAALASSTPDLKDLIRPTMTRAAKSESRHASSGRQGPQVKNRRGRRCRIRYEYGRFKAA